MGLEEALRMMKEITGSDLSEQKLWYSLKYDTQMLTAVEGDTDVRIIFKGNDEHDYLYVGGNIGLMRRAQKSVAYVKDEYTLVMMAWYVTRVGEIAMMLCNWIEKEMATSTSEKVGHWSMKEANVELQTRLRLGREIIRLSDDDEISVMSDDVGDEETIEKGSDEMTKEKLWKKMDKHKQDILKWKNGVWERMEQKLFNTYKKMGCIAAIKCYSLMLGEYSVELTNKCKLVYEYVQPIYKTMTQQLIYKKLVHPLETHNMGEVDDRTGLVINGEKLDEKCNRRILLPINGR
ncbi:LOW QUALITY PROTEIN: hypothetical protein Cgig2_013364 [Carnegiea gigantea]|uniref:Uncharacterized protein n=1 Tax=Carnegiea gigantea TaxID=171969 RepID=A0A9Q1JFT3_9CARY|nr:LOW QUALITY PROTEIN: hypothetical protein Cgig2_013364 [Carnegiea gigantea]